MEKDFAVHYSTDIEHKSLYQWCLRQTQEDGTQVDGDLIPWFWSLKFEATEVLHSISYSKEWNGLDDGDGDEKEDADDVDTSETLHAKLIPVERLSLPPRYFMFGYRDAIEEISLTIRRGSNTRCTAHGFAKYRSEIDFRYKEIPHHLGFDLRLTEDKFDRILQLMKLNTLDRFYFRVGKVDGFYSDWSPEITTNRIHALPKSCLEELSLEEHADRLPILGKVRDCEIIASRKVIVDQKKEEDDL